MKVKLEENYRRFYTLDEFDNAKAVISAEKEDEETAKGWAEFAAREALKDDDDYMRRIVEAEAETAKNGRLNWNQFCEGSGFMDVWVSALVETWGGYVKIGAYLTDIWATGSVPYRQHRSITKFNKQG